MPFETIVKYCAPTLAGMKIGNLFTYKFTCLKQLVSDIKERNNLLNAKGIYFKILKTWDNLALIYVYRKNKLEETLNVCKHREFLTQKGYKTFDINSVISVLKKHLVTSEFPHEIGIFLGYPLSDIQAFIEDKGANAKYVGCWKAYTNEDYAKQISDKYKKCTNIYCKKFAEGTDIIRLTVAC